MKYKKRESILLLDLLESMRGIKVVSLANSASAVTESNFNHKIDEYKVGIQLKLVSSTSTNLFIHRKDCKMLAMYVFS